MTMAERQLEGTPLAAALSDQAERLSHCVHCGFCLPACPTYVRLGDEADSPRGRLHLMGAVVEGRLSPASDAFQRHLDRCLGCRACESVCPSGVEYGLLLERARQVAINHRRQGWSTRFLLGAIRRRWLFLPWMWTSRLLRATGLPSLLARLAPGRSTIRDGAGGALGRVRFASAMLAASLPSPLPEGVGEVAVATDPGLEDPPPTKAPSRGRVGLLEGCVQGQLFSRVNRATVQVLEANGWEVTSVADQGCCGALHAHGGRLEEARDMARRNLRAFREAADDLDHIVANAAGCGATMREYHHLLENDHGDVAARFARRVRDVSELVAGPGTSPRVGGSLSLKVAYDAPCHLLHGQKVSEPPLRLLRSIPGLELVPLEGAEECCGGAGIYGITHPSLGGRIGADKVEAIRASGAQVVATGNPGCIMQIGAGLRMAGLRVPVVHPVELLAESYRRAGIPARRGE
jgi:glycolate oxidase iron-sulfur subunit